MFSKKYMLFISALALLVFVGYASTSSNTNDERTTTHASSSNDNNTNPSPDFDGDGTVGLPDFLLFVDVFGLRQGDEGYDARFDLDGDRTIGIGDFLIFVNNFGKEIHAPFSPDMVTLPPPTWVFAGDVPATDRTALREEMEYVRAYFADRFGVEATGFTVLVASNYEALSPVYRDVVGKDLSSYYHPQAIHSYAWVTSSTTGSAVVILMYGTLSERAGNRLKHHIAHEYFHVLQGQLASGFAQLQDGEIAWHTNATYRDKIGWWRVWLPMPTTRTHHSGRAGVPFLATEVGIHPTGT